MVRECLIVVVHSGSNKVFGETVVTATEDIRNLDALCNELVKEDAPFPELRGLASLKLGVYYDLNDQEEPIHRICKARTLDDPIIQVINGLPCIVVVASFDTGK